ncbi:hypothetical protein BX616_005776 [Lobosporangium transversale]|uniref:Hydrophobic surface binding protein A-domain-containing protein n=1 Tax=Lobosporangium transversale TaxID=64571 RepID=A0A1Y2G8L6_9FUNG|nr:hypothetical protein BCR41DRAFT_363685 [Lobosporangium transversale]KAF9897332.1 hypothetical protein BX616_005776 [Lobosporangium transversale]ORY99743.1 hypothetical protein BCR41DRAFT_363685 [Lobosporangium transversale]|eukprot:XP_021875977.1 hypothetical protein BCR41DRAFT_363685 [Lobosporangium transversale]
MRTTTFFAYMMAMLAMLCSMAVASTEISLEKRAPPSTAAFDATVDLLVKEQAHIVVKAFADVCTDTDIASAVKTDLRVQISGLLDVDFGLGTKLSAALQSSIKAAIKAEVDAEIKSEFTANLKANIAAIIVKRCPNKDAACIKIQAKAIVSEAAKLTVKASAKIAVKVQAKLAAKIKAAIDLQIKKLSINLLLLKIKVTGDVNVSANVAHKFKAAVDLCTKACADIQVKQAIKVRSICSA